MSINRAYIDILYAPLDEWQFNVDPSALCPAQPLKIDTVHFDLGQMRSTPFSKAQA